LFIATPQEFVNITEDETEEGEEDESS
jgi:hypothetical protein